jgi:hypothetical protein
VSLVRQIEVAVANGRTTREACREAGITEQTYCRRQKKYGGLRVDQVCRLKELEQENAQLKRLVAELSLQKLTLRDLLIAKPFPLLDNTKTATTALKKHRLRKSSLASRPLQPEDGASSG